MRLRTTSSAKRLRAQGLLSGFALLAFSTLVLAQAGEELIKLSREDRVRRLQRRTWEITAVPVQGDLRIDGRLDDRAWTFAEPVTDFYQRETNEGLPATEGTEARVLFDAKNLYVGFRCYDRDPNRSKARTMFRDENIASDDAVAIMLDTFSDHRSAIFLATNANGILFDMLQNGQTRFTRNINWDTVWTARGSNTPEGWEAEVVIPFKSMRFEPPASGEEVVFGIGFKRNLPRKNEETYWPFVSNDSTWYRPAELGHLRGLRDIHPGRSVEFRPYVLGGVDSDAEIELTHTREEMGLDLRWGITPALTADLTVNTDFAQEEVDIQQINFTRFSLFFPEKRQVFLEGQRMFQFGVPREVDLVFTRRIGLSDGGEIIPILAGARVSGRQGRYSLGAMTMQTDEAVGIPGENFAVLRLRRDIFNRSTVGALFTSRQGGGNYNRVFGADVSLYFGESWSVEGFLARVDEPGHQDGEGSAHLRVAYDADRLGFTYRFLDIGESFRPGVGFVRRLDSRKNFLEARYSPRPSSELIRQFHFTAFLSYVTNQSDVPETRRRGGRFRTTFESGEQLTFEYTNHFEFIDQPFRLRPDVVISSGAYDFNAFEARFATFRRRHARLDLRFSTGGFWSGQRDTLSLGANYRINRNIGVSGDYDINWVDLPEGAFTTHLVSSRIQIAFRTNVVLMSLFQYNHDTRFLSSNIRFNWIPKPGTDFFVVYNELDERASPFQVKNRSLTVKLNYLFAF
ncbi:MAG: DUF5916 domain-containing protein [Acidobacteriota bacterium]